MGAEGPGANGGANGRLGIHDSPGRIGRFRSEVASSLKRLMGSGRRRLGLQPPRSSAPRIALYSQGMIGFGHIRRNATIAQALRHSVLKPVIVMIAEAWQAGSIPLPAGVDCVTLPGM